MNISKRIVLVLIALALMLPVVACANSANLDEDYSENVSQTSRPDKNTGNSNTSNKDKTPDKQTNTNPDTQTLTKPDTQTQTNTNTKPDNQSSNPNTQTQTPEPEQEGPDPVDEGFKNYVSNVYVPTGNHYALVSQTEKTQTFRGVFPVQQHGKLEYCFYFSNNVESTWEYGKVAYRDMPTEPYEILSASVAITKNENASTIVRKTSITFDGKKTRSVEPYDMFWSDPVTFNVAEGEYLVFEWKVKYTFIPCNLVNGTGIGFVSNNGSSFSKAKEGLPMPSMLGAKRSGVSSISFIGDSITAGEGGGLFNGYVAQISKGLGNKYSVWNLGLGYSRAEDAVNSPTWVKKATTTDNTVICFGTNDINAGAYELGRRNAKQVLADIEKIAKECKAAGSNVILFSTPPYTYANETVIQNWRDIIFGLKTMAKTNGYQFFDFASYLVDKKDGTTPAYGGHPNGEGCKAAADGFLASVKNGSVKLK